MSGSQAEDRERERRGVVPRGTPFIVVTGLSGAGKSHALRALEDLGYFCVDNLPTTLIPTLAKLSIHGGDIDRVAIVVDVREGNFLSSFPKIFKKLRKMRGLNPILIFLEASSATLVRRFSETRRPHPLAPDRSASEGIQEERERMTTVVSTGSGLIVVSSFSVRSAETLPPAPLRGSIFVTAPTRVPPRRTSLPTTRLAALGTWALRV